MKCAVLNFDVDRYINPYLPRPRLDLLPKPISWVLGYRDKPTARIGNILIWWWAFIGGFCSILIIEAVFRSEKLKSEGTPIIIASLGAAAILEFHTIDSPLAQPRNCLVSQIFAATIGVAITKLFQLNPNFEDLQWIAGALSVGVTSAVMGITNTVHPPAGATALLAATSVDIIDLGWFFIPLVILGVALMLGIACVLNNIQRQFPLYWWTAVDLTPPSANENDIEKQKPTIAESLSTLKSESHYHDEYEDTKITIDGTGISIPNWLELEPQETSILEVLEVKLRQRLRQMRTGNTGETRVRNR